MNNADKIEQARRILLALDMDEERSNQRSAMTLLALLHMRPDSGWYEATNPMMGIRAIMDWIRDHYERDYAPNTRETIRRFTLHQFAEATLVTQNPDRPDRAVNSPKWNYQITQHALEVVREYGSINFQARVDYHLVQAPGLRVLHAAARKMQRIPVCFPDGQQFDLSPGGQNELLKLMIEEFCPRFTPGAEILYVGDADKKWAVFNKARLFDLGLTFDAHGKMPDLVAYSPDKNWLILAEAANSHGPIDGKRRTELAVVFRDAEPGLVYVSCFPSRKELRRYLPDIGWETEVWCADDPTHLIHFNGDRFLGPHH